MRYLVLGLLFMLPVTFIYAAYNLRHVGVFNPANSMADVFTVDNKVYALMGYRPNDTTSGFKIYKANLQYDIEDSLIVVENVLQTYITNAVVNDDNTISLAISKHNDTELQPAYFILYSLDKDLKIIGKKNINYRNFGIDGFEYANLVKMNNNNVLLNLLFNKDFIDELRFYNTFVKCNSTVGALNYYEDTVDMYHSKNNDNYSYRFFATFNLTSVNDTIVYVKVPYSEYRFKFPLMFSGHVVKRLNNNLQEISNTYAKSGRFITYFGSFHTYFTFHNHLYFYGIFKVALVGKRNNPNIIQILPDDSMKVITRLDTTADTYPFSGNPFDVGNNKAIVIKNNEWIYGVTTHLLNNDSNSFGLTYFNKDLNIVWNRFYKFSRKKVFINGMIASGNELIVYGWQRDKFDKIYRPLFLTITEDGWLTGINESIVKHEIELNLYPNPAIQKFTIQTNAKVQSVQITDMQGKIIKTVGSNIDFNEIDIADLPPGMYVVQLQTPNGMLTKKLVVE
ncbi:MAG: T9SS type A sorting domain-containing protein [Bacteroidia bacterium]